MRWYEWNKNRRLYWHLAQIAAEIRKLRYGKGANKVRIEHLLNEIKFKDVLAVEKEVPMTKQQAAMEAKAALLPMLGLSIKTGKPLGRLKGNKPPPQKPKAKRNGRT